MAESMEVLVGAETTVETKHSVLNGGLNLPTVTGFDTAFAKSLCPLVSFRWRLVLLVF